MVNHQSDDHITDAHSADHQVGDQQWLDKALREAEKKLARLEGATLVAREMADRLSNHLAVIGVTLELLVTEEDLPSYIQASVSRACKRIEAAKGDITQLQRISRIETRQTSLGPALDLAGSAQREIHHLLVVEDDQKTREIIELILAQEGYEVQTAGDGEAALALLESYRPDLILLDMQMPVMDGWQFTEAYRRRPGPHVPIVVATGAIDAASRVEQLEAQAYLAKPFDLDQLLSIVKRVVDSQPSALLPETNQADRPKKRRRES